MSSSTLAIIVPVYNVEKFVNETLLSIKDQKEKADEIILFHKMNSDVEKQAIGRAQRPGRKNPLIVHHLLHENEV